MNEDNTRIIISAGYAQGASDIMVFGGLRGI